MDWNLLETRLWELEFAATDRYVTIESSDPWYGSLSFLLDESTLQLGVDASLNIGKRFIEYK